MPASYTAPVSRMQLPVWGDGDADDPAGLIHPTRPPKCAYGWGAWRLAGYQSFPWSFAWQGLMGVVATSFTRTQNLSGVFSYMRSPNRSGARHHFSCSSGIAARADNFELFNLNSPISGSGTLSGTVNLDLTPGDAIDSTINAHLLRTALPS